jgi:uncharacterized protein YbaR (Trm112 family)
MHEFLIDLLQCPACQAVLTWKIKEKAGSRIREGEATCQLCRATYPVREEIGLLLTPDLPRDDLWAQVDNRLSQHFAENPDLESQLMDVPLETLNAADQFLRGKLLEERGQYAEAKSISDKAFAGLYTPEYLACSERQYAYVIEQVKSTGSPVIDLASGRGYLVQRMLEQGIQPVVATDLSPSVLRRNRRWFEFLGLYDSLSLVACDARRMPFKDGSVGVMTTNVGLMNVGESGDVLSELKRIAGGVFWAVNCFYPATDETNAAAIRQFGLDAFLFEEETRRTFAAANWQLEIANCCSAPAKPTPASELLGIGIDGLPVTDTELTWCTLVAKNKGY